MPKQELGNAPHPTRILVAATLGAALGFVGASVVNVALPTFQTELGANASDIQWIVSAYNLAIAALLLSAGAYSDRQGHFRIFQIGLVLYAIASIACALAWDPAALIAGRALQGFAGALLVPSSLGLVNTAYPAHLRGHAVGLWSSFSAVGGGMGPLIGGLLIDAASWRYLFWINIPIVLVVGYLLIGQHRQTPDTAPQRAFDWTGAVASILALGLLTIAAIESARLGISHPIVVGLFIVAALSGFVFVRVQQRTSNPLMPLLLFRSRNFSSANVVTFLAYWTIGGGFYVMMLTWIQIQGYSPIAAGAITLPFMLFTGGFAHAVGKLVRRIGPKLPLSAGVALLGLGFISFALPAVGTSFWIGYLPGVLVTAAGIALLVAPLTTVVVGSVELSHSATASGINSAVARSAILLSVAVLGAIHFGLFKHAAILGLDQLALTPALDAYMRDQLINMAAAEVPNGTAAGVGDAIRAVIVGSFMYAARIVILIAGAISLLGAIIAFIFVDAPERTSLLNDSTR